MPDKIPIFPIFRLITIDDIEWYRAYYIDRGLNPYADISPDDLFTWLNFNDDLMISNLDNGIVMRYTNVLDNNKFNVIPLSNPLYDLSLEKIMFYLKDSNLPLELHEVPSTLCSKLDSYKWQIENDRDSYEYILDTNQQILLEGDCFKSHRRCVNSFDREHANDTIDVQYYKEIDDGLKEVFIKYINTIPFNSSKEASRQNYAEPIAIQRNLEYASIFHKKALIIKINGRIVSLAIVSYLDDNTAAINHLKVNYSIKHIFKYTNYQLAKALKEDGISEINIEQDLGKDGMRMFKQNMRPSRFLEKKIIRPRHL